MRGQDGYNFIEIKLLCSFSASIKIKFEDFSRFFFQGPKIKKISKIFNNRESCLN